MIVAGLAASLSCGPGAPEGVPSGPSRKAPARPDVLNIFFTGSVLGKLKPCGCSGGQLGGLERRPAVFNTVSSENRLLIDTGSLVETNSDQDLVKFSVITEAFGLLHYDLVNLTDRDVEIARGLGLPGSEGVKFVSPHGTGNELGTEFHSKQVLNGEPVNISVLTVDLDSSRIERIQEHFAAGQKGQNSFNILIVNRYDKDFVASLTRTGVVDCLVCPSQSDEPVLIESSFGKPLVFSPGRFGRYICRLQIEKARVGDRLKVKFSKTAVSGDLQPDPSLVGLYESYQQIVRDRNLLEKHPRYVLPNDLKYAGSQSCKACHAPEYEKWQSTSHSHAYATLERVGSQFDPECVVCHVIGLDYESGFVSAEQTEQMENVGCENCHGPGSEHIKTVGQTGLTEPRSDCIDCHTPEHSGEYAGNERAFHQKIIHWTEPNSPGNVK